MHDTHRPSALEIDLKRIVRAHPTALIHPNSPSGPYVRAALWTAGDHDQILGQALWSTEHNRWVVRAFDTEAGGSSLVVVNPATKGDISNAITEVIDRVRNPALAALDSVAPDLANLLRSLRGRP
ncbi:hypothetical protein HFP72_20500 [Nocardiopsis sp. ARC36]